MEWYVVLLGGIVLLLALFSTGIPLFIGFLILNVGGVYLLAGQKGFVLVANSVFNTANIEALSAIPMFILMGELLTRSGSVDMLFTSMDKLIGKIRGRQYVLTILISVIFGALSGAAMAVSAMMARALYPTMKERKYDERLSIGAILAGSSLAPIIPPSVLVVLVATLADISVAKLLIAGIMPGLLAAGLFLIYIGVRVFLDKSLSPDHEVIDGEKGWKGKIFAFGQMLPFSITIFSVMGLILLGIATPSEAAATGVLGSLLVAAIYKKCSFRMAWKSVEAAAAMTAMIMVIVVSSNLFGQLLAFTGSTRKLVAFAATLTQTPYIMLIMMLMVVFIMCMFLDQTALMLIIAPIFAPLVASFQFDPIWFWLLVLLNLTVGGITPPFGYTMFAFKAGSPDTELSEIFHASLPFVVIFIILMVLVILFPAIATYIPSLINR